MVCAKVKSIEVKLGGRVELLIGLEAISRTRRTRHANGDVHLNGQLRPVLVRDRSIARCHSGHPRRRPTAKHRTHRRAICRIVTVRVCVGERVGAGKPSPPSRR